MANLRNLFISASPEAVRQACETHAIQEKVGEQVEEVAVIPAQGGCFLVTKESAPDSSRSWLPRLPVGRRGASLEQEMEQIKQEAETNDCPSIRCDG